jgi:OmpA-OmpF porin, OOP family
MSHLLEQLTSAVTPKLVGYLAKLTGEAPAHIDKAISAAVPTILSAMTGAVQSPSAQGHVTRLVNDPANDGTLLAQLPALYQGTMTSAPVYRIGTQLLQSVFGKKLSQATQTIAVLSSIKPASSALLVSTLAPHMLAMIGQRLREGGGTNPANLARLLEGEHAAVTKALPPSLASLFGAPNVTAAAATAATSVAAARPGMTATSAPNQSVPLAKRRTPNLRNCQ